MSAEAAVKEFSQEIKDLGDSIARLTLMQANELVGYLKEAYQIEPAAAGAVVMAPAAGPQAEGEADEPTEFDVILKDCGSQKIPVIKIVREVTSLGLKEAKALVDGAPTPVKEGMAKEDANALKVKLEEAGATVELKPVG